MITDKPQTQQHIRFESRINKHNIHYVAIMDFDLCIGKMYAGEVIKKPILDTHNCEPAILCIEDIRAILEKMEELGANNDCS